ncbi:hypothetical protein LEP1GSC088_3200 [Leptospira interrogans str. L1207]|uniref:Uncharacterized protein n=1 Tax=Leptospira interrogans str. 2006001854 TaxID=1001590 RepID=M6GYX4_LEPIR|nr:hypothetical protein LEP1GSC037_2927 [Leptospira interrogans str. 2006001854]EMN50745.1 hypothetical protein LEP1GSC088_3200 [Leptospira interrogans str. L1207]
MILSKDQKKDILSILFMNRLPRIPSFMNLKKKIILKSFSIIKGEIIIIP